ncbi:hypothetical protein MKW98_010479, partial [Papaver atlanticum]
MALHILLNLQCFLLLLCLQCVCTTETPITASKVIAKPGCQDKCGNVSIPYPFGIGYGCAIDYVHFIIICNNNLPSATFGNLNVSSISILNGEITLSLDLATDCSNKSTQLVGSEIGEHIGKFTFSNTKNKFIAIGCDTFAYLVTSNDNASIGTGCLSSCNKIGDSTNGTCDGIGCCEASIPSGLNTYEAIVGGISTSRGISTSGRRNLSSNPCSYAFLTEKDSFNFSSSYLENFRNHGTLGVPAVVDWAIGTETCEEAQRNSTTYACGSNADCVKGNNDVPGYRCSCKPGYEGNPYLNKSTGGYCQDIDECSVKDLNNCSLGQGSNCTNTPGSFFCFCYEGYNPEFRDKVWECSPIQSRRIFNEIVL